MGSQSNWKGAKIRDFMTKVYYFFTKIRIPEWMEYFNYLIFDSNDLN